MELSELIDLKEQALIQKYENEIHKLELESDLIGWGDLAWLKKVTGYKSTQTVKEKLLWPFRRELEGHLVTYPQKQGQPWRVNKRPLAEWLEENFERIEN